jgi:hypothetical protein
MKCIAEGRPLTREVRRYTKSEYPNPAARDDLGIRTFKEDALTFSNEGSALIDIRLPGGFSAEITHMPEYPQEGVLRGGHIPGAKNVPWKTAVNEDGIFKSADELRRIYTEGLGLNPSEEMGWSKRRSAVSSPRNSKYGPSTTRPMIKSEVTFSSARWPTTCSGISSSGLNLYRRRWHPQRSRVDHAQRD